MSGYVWHWQLFEALLAAAMIATVTHVPGFHIVPSERVTDEVMLRADLEVPSLLTNGLQAAAERVIVRRTRQGS